MIIAGPTASGKSALALALAEAQGGTIVNADALQVWDAWRVLTARPGPDEEARAPHLLYGHLPCGADYSVGHWLREVAPILSGDVRPIIVGGTGLYLTALTEGLAEIPAVPPAVRAEADALRRAGGTDRMFADLDPATAARTDAQNPMRVQRAWEVARATGRGLAAWQDDTGTPLLSRNRAETIVLIPDRDWLAERIDRRFRAMVADGALDEVAANLDRWQEGALWTRAIGAPELAAHLRGETGLDAAIAAAQASSRQYAKRQRSWFRGRMHDWRQVSLP